ncbi:hypothetical protein GCM10018787_26550 [Streptomyces thermodiastaticus]|nr:hypothetical protein GCM10018787_26550 [Streptomyces thermodiastaticus]
MSSAVSSAVWSAAAKARSTVPAAPDGPEVLVVVTHRSCHDRPRDPGRIHSLWTTHPALSSHPSATAPRQLSTGG